MALQSPARPNRPEHPATDEAAPVAPTVPVSESLRARPHRPPRRALALVALLAAVGIVVWLVPILAPLRGEPPLTASGTVEADEVQLSSEIVGRILAVLVQEGQAVNAGDVIARLDDASIQVQYRQADAAMRQLLELQIEKYAIRTPVAGTVTRIPAHTGEIASPGQPIATVADLSSLRLTVYVLESSVGQVSLRQPVVVTADPFPGREFTGVVTSINQKAEFTPRNVQTQRDRQNLVFGVKVLVENQSQALKPGLPVDVRFVQE